MDRDQWTTIKRGYSRQSRQDRTGQDRLDKTGERERVSQGEKKMEEKKKTEREIFCV